MYNSATLTSMHIRPTRKATLILALALASACAPLVHAQDALHSLDDDYYDLLALAGLVERPSLDYRSLSDQKWGEPSGASPWADMLKKRATRSAGPIELKVYGPTSFSSYNTAYPHGMNDGALYQGVGLNTNLNVGIRLEAFGFSASLLPDVLWEQNRYYDIVAVTSTIHPNPYSSMWTRGIDQPQRFGDASLFGYDWGNSELRYDLGPATIGFGEQAAWLGPGRNNAIILSDNAEPFPKLDLGIHKTPTPVGDIEFRAFWGKLTESDYFDADTSNDHNLITCLAAAWSPTWTPGLTFALHRTMLSRWTDYDWTGMLTLLWPFMNSIGESVPEDQRASISVDYLIPGVGFETYFEWARNDFSPSLDFIIRYPFHTQAYTIGARKLVRFSESLWLSVLAELTNTESSQDYQMIGPNTFYEHGIITQGYTNRGQILGAGIGTGGNSQYLGFTLYYPRGSAETYVQRINRNNDYVYFLHFYGAYSDKRSDEYKFNSELAFGLRSTYFVMDSLALTAGAAYCDNRNPTYDPVGDASAIIRNVYLELGASYRL